MISTSKHGITSLSSEIYTEVMPLLHRTSGPFWMEPLLLSTSSPYGVGTLSSCVMSSSTPWATTSHLLYLSPSPSFPSHLSLLIPVIIYPFLPPQSLPFLCIKQDPICLRDSLTWGPSPSLHMPDSGAGWLVYIHLMMTPPIIAFSFVNSVGDITWLIDLG